MSKGRRKKVRRKSELGPAPEPTAPLSAPSHAPEPDTDPKLESAGATLFKVESAPFFRLPDWQAFVAATLVTLAVYMFTLAPNVTLEDSGELATASMYAGVPHAPGYPFWTIYSWAFTKLIPFGNIAWRVGVSSAVAAALACGLTALMISRGSRLFFNSMDGLRELDDKAQRTISLAAGFAGGTVFGLTGFMWSQAVIVEVYTLSTFTFAGVLALLMRWYFIPDRHWSLYAAYLVFGLCLANHQTLLLAAVGIELLIFMRHREIGRDLFICNSLIYLAGLLYFSSQESGSTTSGKLLLFGTFNLVGVGCILLAVWHSLPRPNNALHSGALLLGSAYFLVFLLLSIFWITFIWPIIGGPTQSAKEFMLPDSAVLWDLGSTWRYGMTNAHRMILLFFFFLGIAGIFTLIWLAIDSDKCSKRSIYTGACLALFLAFGLIWMWFLLQSRGHVIAHTPPWPLETVENARTQLADYFAKANKTTLLFVLASIAGLTATLSHNWVTTKAKALTHWKPLFVTRIAALTGLLFYFFMPLSSLTNPPMNWAYPRTAEGFRHAITRGQYTGPAQESADRVSRFIFDIDGNKRFDGGQVGVFISETLQEFNPAYVLLALLPLALILRMQDRERRWLGGMALIFTILTLLMLAFRNTGGSEQQRHLNKVFFESSHLFVALGLGWGLALAAGFIARHWDTYRQPLLIGASTLFILELVWWPITRTTISTTPTSLAFTLANYEAPILIAAALLGVLLMGGVCALLFLWRKPAPTKLVLLIICLVPIRHGLANWWDNELRGHYFGYWYGRDMFVTDVRDKEGELIYPPMARNSILFGGTDAGRFCPTYMIFCESLTDSKHRTDAAFDRRDVNIITQNALADRTYLQYIRAHYNRSTQFDPPFIHSLLTNPEPNPSVNNAITNHLNNIRNNFSTQTALGMLQVSNLIAQISLELGPDKFKNMTDSSVMPSDFITSITENIKDAAKKERVINLNAKLRSVEGNLTKQETIANSAVAQLNNIKAKTLNQRPFAGMDLMTRTLRPLDDWMVRLGDSVEYDRRAGAAYFIADDFVDFESLAHELTEGKSTVAAYVKNHLDKDTLNAFKNQDGSGARRLANDLNRLLESDINEHRKAIAKLLDQERREMALLLPDLPSDPQQAGQVLGLINAILKRQQLVSELAQFCSSKIEFGTIKLNLLTNDQDISDLYNTIIKDTGPLTALKEILKERRQTIPTTCSAALDNDSRLFQDVQLSPATKALRRQQPWTHARTMLNRRLLEDAFSGMIRRSPGGVYPALEIHTPDDNDYSKSYNRVTQIPGITQESAVWEINSDLTKAIFDKNPGHKFYLEESMPLPWMYPHLVPYGIILEIERTPSGAWNVDQQQKILSRDRDFWSQYMDRLIGVRIVEPGTPMLDICNWINRVYLRRNHTNHTPAQGRFLRSYVSQRAFSKLRLSIAKLYDWRTKNIDNLIVGVHVDEIGTGRIDQLMKRKKTLLAEADFAFRQAYALCPVSAETVHEYLTFLLRNGKTEEARLLLATSFQLDPSDNALSIWTRRSLMHQALADYSIGNLINARSIVKIGREHFPRFTTYNPNLADPEDKVLSYNLADRVAFDNLLSRGKYKEAFKHINRRIPRKPGATEIDWRQPFDWKSLISYTGILTGQLDAKPENYMLQILSSQVFRMLRTFAKNREQIVRQQKKYGVIQKIPYPFLDLQRRFLEAEAKLRRQLTKQTPDRPDAWYELGVTLNHLRQTNESIDCLRKAWKLSGQTNAPRSIVDIRELIRTTNALNNLRDFPEFKAIIQKP